MQVAQRERDLEQIEISLLLEAIFKRYGFDFREYAPASLKRRVWRRVHAEKLTSDHPIDLCRYQVANCYMGRAGLINSGGASGANDFAEAVATAVINKRAGGMGLISGRKAFQRPMPEGVRLLNAIQDVYLDSSITVA